MEGRIHLSVLVLIVLFANGKALLDLQDSENIEEGVDVSSDLNRVERSLGPFEDPCKELKRFRDEFELSDQESNLLLERNVKEPVLLLRMITVDFHEVIENVTTPGTDEFQDAVDAVTAGLSDREVIPGFADLVDQVFVPSIEELGLDADNRTQVRVSVLLTCKSRASDVIAAMHTNFTRLGLLGDDLRVTYIFKKAYSPPLPKQTVYGAYVRLIELQYMPMFTYLGNTATLAITNELLLTTRPLFRNRFGEYFIRGVVVEYFEGSVIGDTVVSLAFLLEASEDNLRDVDDLWSVQAREQGALGNHKFDSDGYIVHELNFVKEEFEQYLIAEVTRAELQLNASEFINNIALPSLGAMLLVLVFVLLCSWEGFCCRRCIEGEKRSACFCCDFASNYDEKQLLDDDEDV